jgi:hypothetical protein
VNDVEQKEQINQEEVAITELDATLDRRYRKRQWLAQVDFWEGVKEFILKRIPGSSRSIDQLY